MRLQEADHHVSIAIFTAMQLFEREHFPRFHLGESLLPQSMGTLKEIGVLDRVG